MTSLFVFSSITNSLSYPLKFLSHLSLTFLDQTTFSPLLPLFFLQQLNYNCLLLDLCSLSTIWPTDHGSLFPKQSLLSSSGLKNIQWLIFKYLIRHSKSFICWSYSIFLSLVSIIPLHKSSSQITLAILWR